MRVELNLDDDAKMMHSDRFFVTEGNGSTAPNELRNGMGNGENGCALENTAQLNKKKLHRLLSNFISSAIHQALRKKNKWEGEF